MAQYSQPLRRATAAELAAPVAALAAENQPVRRVPDGPPPGTQGRQVSRPISGEVPPLLVEETPPPGTLGTLVSHPISSELPPMHPNENGDREKEEGKEQENEGGVPLGQEGKREEEGGPVASPDVAPSEIPAVSMSVMS